MPYSPFCFLFFCFCNQYLEIKLKTVKPLTGIKKLTVNCFQTEGYEHHDCIIYIGGETRAGHSH